MLPTPETEEKTVKRPKHVPVGWVAWPCLDGYIFTPDPDGEIPSNLLSNYFLEEVPPNLEKESFAYKAFYVNRHLCIIDVPQAKLTATKIKDCKADHRVAEVVNLATQPILDAINNAKKLPGPLATV